MVELTNDDLKRFIAQWIIPDLKQEARAYLPESDHDDNYLTFTIQRRDRYY